MKTYDATNTWASSHETLRNNNARKPDCLPLGCMCSQFYERTCADPNCPRQMWSGRKFSGIHLSKI